MDPARRRELTRYGAPAAFLAAVTIAVLLIKAGLNNGSSSQSRGGRAPTTTQATTTHTAATTTTPKLVLTGTPTTTAATTTTTPGARYYVIQNGDTLGAIASRYSTTVAELQTLNPSIDPNALHPGDRIRVG
jgi:LysM repeat protein